MRDSDFHGDSPACVRARVRVQKRTRIGVLFTAMLVGMVGFSLPNIYACGVLNVPYLSPLFFAFTILEVRK